MGNQDSIGHLRVLAEDPLEHRIDILGVIPDVEHVFEGRVIDIGRHFRVCLEQVEKRQAF